MSQEITQDIAAPDVPPSARVEPARAGRRSGAKGPGTAPSLREERRILRTGHRLLAAVDEVGRGALAGPVTVGIVLVDEATRSAPAGVRDSKLLTPAARVALAPKLRRWAPRHAVGHASPAEIDEIGIIAALRLAACRALSTLPELPDCVLLDGKHNWLTPPTAPAGEAPPQEEVLFDLAQPAEMPAPGSAEAASALLDPHLGVPVTQLPVVMKIKADMRCAAVAAASVLAKVERDAIMVDLAARHPQYGWELNKGYSAPEHVRALQEHGASLMHRRSWTLPGLDAGAALFAADDPFAGGDVELLDLRDPEPHVSPAPRLLPARTVEQQRSSTVEVMSGRATPAPLSRLR